jgi:hypothetical protein
MNGTRRAVTVGLGGGLLSVILVGGALAAGAPEPHAGKYYDTFKWAEKHKTYDDVSLYISPSDPLDVVSGTALEGADHSSEQVECGSATKTAQIGFPGATLKLSGGRYAFSVKWTDHSKLVTPKSGGGERITHIKLKVKMTGTVKSAKLITGTLKVTGGKCTTKKAFHYPASYDPSF